jgi:hypothetical protein
MSDADRPSRLSRAAVACVAGFWAGAVVWLRYQHLPPTATSDFDAAWAAARALRAGMDPYAAIQTPPWPWPLQYPLPAVLVAAPFSFLALDAARAAFMALSVGLLAFGLSRRAWWPLIGLLGGPLLIAVFSVQWTPLLTAAVLFPWLAAAWATKPTTGVALFAGYPDRRAVIGGVALVVLAFVASPHWIEGWSKALQGAPQRPAILRLGGVVLLLALLRWRLPEGRQLATLALVPLSPHLYEAVPLILVARSRTEMLVLTVCGTLGGIAGYLWPPTHVPDHGPRQWAIVFLTGYLPALFVVLRHRVASGRLPKPLEPLDLPPMRAPSRPIIDGSGAQAPAPSLPPA